MKRVTLSIGAPPLREEIERFSVFCISLSRLERNKMSEHSFNTSFSVCIPSLNPPAQKSHNQTKIMLKKIKESKGLQLNTHISGIHFGDIYNHSVTYKGNEGVLY